MARTSKAEREWGDALGRLLENSRALDQNSRALDHRRITRRLRALPGDLDAEEYLTIRLVDAIAALEEPSK